MTKPTRKSQSAKAARAEEKRMAKIEAERTVRAERVAKVWRNDLSHKDWLLDGRPVRGTFLLEKFNNLDWDKAWVDLGPSIAGNLGPYWHVPMKEGHGDTTHRLYPKVLQSKWAMLILHACNEVKRAARSPQKSVRQNLGSICPPSAPTGPSGSRRAMSRERGRRRSPMDYPVTGRQFASIRKRLGLSLYDWGRALGYAGNRNTIQVAIHRYETGERDIPPWIGRLASMFDLHGVPPEFIEC